MPYQRNEDLPPSVRNALPEHAQDIYRAAFNNAWQRYDEDAARRIAWAAVKKTYRKVAGVWRPIDETEGGAASTL